MTNPTLADIAAKAGVSLATVDRVMNGRSSASKRSQTQVMQAATDLGYQGLRHPTKSRKQPVKLIFALPEGTNAFIHELGQNVTEQARQMPDVTASVVTVPRLNPVALAASIKRLKGKADGVAIVAIDHPAVRDAVKHLIEAKMHVVTIASDLPSLPHLGYIGLDNVQAGRLAGYILGRLLPQKPAKIAAFAGSLSYRGHQEREMGFRQILSEDFPHLHLVEIVDVREDRKEARNRMSALLKTHPDLAGIYNAGGATAGIAEALSGDIVFIAHDATKGNETLLLDGRLDAVIDQNARLQIREALLALTHAARQEDFQMVPPRVQVIFRENLPSE